MNDRILNKYLSAKRAEEEAEALPMVEADELEDLGSFGWLRGVRDRAIMLELRHRDGRVSAFGYAWLEHADFDPSEGITLQFAGKSVRIIGSNLNAESHPNVRLFAGIVRHRVPWIQEADELTALESSPGKPVIERLDVDA